MNKRHESFRSFLELVAWMHCEPQKLVRIDTQMFDVGTVRDRCRDLVWSFDVDAKIKDSAFLFFTHFRCCTLNNMVSHSPGLTFWNQTK